MSFNPLSERGIPLDRQLRNWSELHLGPYEKNSIDPSSRCRIITLNGIEAEAILFSHQFARHTADLELKRTLAQIRRVEQQQQKAINWLIPATETTLEVTIGYEQVAVDLTAWLARHETDPYLKQNFEFGLLEDFDHLYRYANLLEMLEGKKAEKVTGPLTEIMPGRPTAIEHRHPIDDVRTPSDSRKADPASLLHVLTLVAAEQQTMNFYMTIGNRPVEPLARNLYLEIAQIEEQHVTQYESLLDPKMTWLEQLVLHEYNECYLYYSFMQTEKDRRLKAIWELHLNMELEHVRITTDLLAAQGKRTAEEFLPTSLPEPISFEDNRSYVRQVLEQQVYLTADGTSFLPLSNLETDHRYYAYQKSVHGNSAPASDRVIELHSQARGTDYRSQTLGNDPLVREGPVLKSVG